MAKKKNNYKKSNQQNQNVTQEKNKEEIKVKENIAVDEKTAAEVVNKPEESVKEDLVKEEAVKEQSANKESVCEESIKVKEDSWQSDIANKFKKVLEEIKGASPESIKTVCIAAAKVALPVLAAVIVLATIISLVKTKNEEQGEEAVVMTEVTTEPTENAKIEPLEENKYPEVNAMAEKFYKALADGDMQTVKAIKDYTDDTELIHLEKKSEFIESYNNINCYTKKGIEDNTYFLYVTYDVKFNDIETTVPGLNTYYVYTTGEGVIMIDGEMDENINATLKLVTSQDDVVDLFNKIDVGYKEAVSADEELNTLLTELPSKIKTSVGVELAKMEADNESQEASETAATVGEEEAEEQPQTQIVNEQVKTTDTVNVRTSDSEEADKLGKAEAGSVLTRVESRINGWSKVIYDGKEAFIKSDYLEVIESATPEEVEEVEEQESPTMVKATTNVNVRNAANTTADKIGSAEAGTTYKVLEDQGEWLKIEYKGQIGFVKAEYFE